MKALEFKSKITDNQIVIPVGIQSELIKKKIKNIRVIILFEDEIKDNIIFEQNTQTQFLEGYSDSDSIYDNY